MQMSAVILQHTLTFDDRDPVPGVPGEDRAKDPQRVVLELCRVPLRGRRAPFDVQGAEGEAAQRDDVRVLLHVPRQQFLNEVTRISEKGDERARAFLV